MCKVTLLQGIVGADCKNGGWLKRASANMARSEFVSEWGPTEGSNLIRLTSAETSLAVESHWAHGGFGSSLNGRLLQKHDDRGP